MLCLYESNQHMEHNMWAEAPLRMWQEEKSFINLVSAKAEISRDAAMWFIPKHKACSLDLPELSSRDSFPWFMDDNSLLL